ncbi:MAG: YceI family protein [Acidimicrobiales bacterium]|nr:MAG: YceI family protein [Acidimicrobiales bacterium]
MGSQGGEEFEGRFKNFDASIKFDPEDLQNTNVVVTIDMASVDAGDAERNEALPGKEWFAVKPFPNAVFTSTSIKHTGGNSYEASGELTLKDISRAVDLPFELKIDGDTAEMSGSTLIDRTDFQVGTGMWKSEDWVAHKVKINVKITAARK